MHAQNDNSWKPSASLENLRQRAKILEKIRQFFSDRHIMEVETPVIGRYTTTDRHIHSFRVKNPQNRDADFYLQTSPEYCMKRLLAAGSGDIYQICKSFRADEQGAKHNPEFTMLEWYRLGFDHHRLMDEVDEIMTLILNTPRAERRTYHELFLKYCQLDIHQCSEKELQAIIQSRGWMNVTENLDWDTCLQLLMSHCIEPHLGFHSPLFVFDFPKTQAALARLSLSTPQVAERFELYIQGNEIANGFHELSDPVEQEQRFKDEQKIRSENNDSIPRIDPHLLSALQHGLPHCSGVALGIDRLVMLATQSERIDQVISFPWDRC
jgi:lysyl-tRNA synthetase class 2